ncbi:hypothetical protein [Tessaracoccus caeni]|uniref:hypothetical protein n=1 Tax=Tessaracoccus caeni TaxID=3031239 RepID=UPI0023DBEA35|nr:hypothetical protein [Tessaracoccus caeni]MDF1489056.1 hypothetical protein [Tessaracoccus caeni]
MSNLRSASRTIALLATACLGLATLGACSPSDAPSKSQATVEVDVYSGQENPVATLGTEALEQLDAFIVEHQDGAPEVEALDDPLGFRGLVVTPDGPGMQWTGARVLKDAVRVTTDDSTVQIEDDDSTAFDIVWNAIRGDLDETVVKAVDES